jgi:hypothetical protein
MRDMICIFSEVIRDKAAQGICKFTTSLAVRLWALQPMVQLKTLALL